eukprot:TRINITY_DN17614_c0_g1_i1.p1 TRINITY_DN17614_c0_g1~~TRINITY_DN17614_c0_g1_i1.p1  ORF type:complete len:134 (-),score=53.09 TRINITY_DN17614_c0_g1_i1:75-476(-)
MDEAKASTPLEFSVSKLYVKNAGERKGLGVFAKQAIAAGASIECCPIIACPDEQWQALEQTTLRDFYLYLDEDNVGIALGYGSLYNHSDNPNAEVRRFPDRHYIEYVALRDIAVDEEICFKYRCAPWFTVVDK